MEAELEADPDGVIDGVVITDVVVVDRQENLIAGFSSRGPAPFTGIVKPDVTAPGVDIMSSIFAFDEGVLDLSYQLFNGTSMASPHVAGAAALLVGGFADISPAEVKSRLTTSAVELIDDESDLPFTVWEQGSGLVNVERAFAAKATFEPTDASFGVWQGNKPVNASVDVAISRDGCTVDDGSGPGGFTSANVDGSVLSRSTVMTRSIESRGGSGSIGSRRAASEERRRDIRYGHNSDTISPMNNVKTVGLLAFMSVLLVLVADWLRMGIGFALGIAAVFNLGAYFFSDKIAIAASRAKPVTEQELPQVYSIMRRLTQQAGMPMPRLYVIESPQPNAFATGRSPKHAAVAVTTGIMQMLNEQELEGVLAHELSHVQNRDILISSVAAMLAAALTILARSAFWFGGGRNRENPLGAVGAILALIIGPLAAMLIRFAISRTREYQADRSGAMITGQPLHLASALQKISEGTARIPMNVNSAVAPLYIDNPLKAFGNKRGGRSQMARLFSTHPPAEERIERLTKMTYGG